jgi:shikimate dehydrogenase
MSIGPETRLFMSVARRPGTFGATVYNELFRRHAIDALYVPRAAPPTAQQLIDAIRTLGIAGCSVSAPLKSEIIPLLDHIDDRARSACSVNTIVLRGDALHGYSTDIAGVRDALSMHAPGDPLRNALIYGAGGVAGAAIIALREAGITDITIDARRPDAATSIADRFDTALHQNTPDRTYDLVINATPAGRDSNDAPALFAHAGRARIVFDMTVVPAPTALHTHAVSSNATVITGVAMSACQLREQARLYVDQLFDLEEITAIIRTLYLTPTRPASTPPRPALPASRS